jgi:hypothetical protein
MTMKTTTEQLPHATVRIDGTEVVLGMTAIGETVLGGNGKKTYLTGDHSVEVRGESLADIVAWAEGLIEQCEALDADLAPNNSLPF